MEIQSRLYFEVNKNDNVYFMQMPVGAPLGEAYDAVFEVLQKIVELNKAAADKMKREESESDQNADKAAVKVEDGSKG